MKFYYVESFVARHVNIKMQETVVRNKKLIMSVKVQ